MDKSTQEALFGLHVDAFLEGLSDDAPKGEDFGLTEEEANRVRDEIVFGVLAS